jgi:hypothetical protein
MVVPPAAHPLIKIGGKRAREALQLLDDVPVDDYVLKCARCALKRTLPGGTRRPNIQSAFVCRMAPGYKCHSRFQVGQRPRTACAFAWRVCVRVRGPVYT